MTALSTSGLVFTKFSASDLGKCLSLTPHATVVGTFQLYFNKQAIYRFNKLSQKRTNRSLYHEPKFVNQMIHIQNRSFKRNCDCLQGEIPCIFISCNDWKTDFNSEDASRTRIVVTTLSSLNTMGGLAYLEEANP